MHDTAESIAQERDDILLHTVLEEKPRELCKVAHKYEDIGQEAEAQSTLKTALIVLDDVKSENPWKYTNYLCYVAYEMARIKGGKKQAKQILKQAHESLKGVSVYYGKRKAEVLSLLKMLSEEARMKQHLTFNSEPDTLTDTRSTLPFEQNYHFLYSVIFLSETEKNTLQTLAASNATIQDILGMIDSIHEEWRQAVALAIFARLYFDSDHTQGALDALSHAEKRAETVKFYWVRDAAYEVISGTYSKMYGKKDTGKLLGNAKTVIALIKDPWKQARAFCRIAEAYLKQGEFELAAQELNHVHAEVLNRIDYHDRTAMSMLLISEVYESIAKSTALSLLNTSARTADSLKEEAHAILKSYSAEKQADSLREYEEFISLKKESALPSHQEFQPQ